MRQVEEKEIEKLVFERKDIKSCYVSSQYDEYVTLILHGDFPPEETSLAKYKKKWHLSVRTYSNAITDLIVNRKKKKFTAYKKRSKHRGRHSQYYWLHKYPPN